MKKIYLLISAALISAGSYAQTLTQANNAFALGNTFSTKQCDSTGITAGGNGAAQTWNYSTIAIHNSTIKNYTTITVASSGSAAAYPSSSVAVSGGPGAISFYSSNTTDNKYWGGNINVGGVAAIFGYSSPAAYARYPMSLTNSTLSATAGTLLVLGNNGTFTGNCTVTATGSGALQLPSITFPNVLKMTTAQIINFSSIVTGTITAVYYDYFSPANSKAPLFSIQTSSIVSLLGSTTQTYVVINSNYIALGVKEQNDKEVLGLEIYPNPTSENVNITFNNPSNETASYEIINSIGQLVKSEKINSVSGVNKQQISLKNLESGMYFVAITVGDKTAYQKINIQ